MAEPKRKPYWRRNRFFRLLRQIFSNSYYGSEEYWEDYAEFRKRNEPLDRLRKEHKERLYREDLERQRDAALKQLLMQAVLDDPIKTVEEHEAILLGKRPDLRPETGPRQELAPDARGLPIGTVTENLTVCPQIAGAGLGFDVSAPWFRPYLETKLNEELPHPVDRVGQPVCIPPDLINAHTMVAGGSRSGKSCVSLHMLKHHLRAGYSVVLMDVKDDTIKQALCVAREAGVANEAITVIWPGQPNDGVPGYNLFRPQDVNPQTAVKEFVDLIKSSQKEDWGAATLDNIFKSACGIIAAYGLSLHELRAFLQRPRYRHMLISKARGKATWELARTDFEYFAYGLKEAEQAKYCQLVLQRFNDLFRSDLMKNMFSASTDDLDLGGLWREQRLILVHLNEAELGKDGLKLLAGLLMQKLFNHAQTRGGNRQVVVFLDEIAATERAVGPILSSIVSRGLSQNMQVITACQFMEQMSSELRQSLLASTDVRISLKLLQADAMHVARGLAFGTGTRVKKVVVSPGGGRADQITFTLMRGNRPAAQAESGSIISRLTGDRTQSIDEVKPVLHLRDDESGKTYRVTEELIKSFGKLPIRVVGPGPFTGVGDYKVELQLPEITVRIAERTTEGEYTSYLAHKLMFQDRRQAIVKIGSRVEGIRTAEIRFPEPLPDVVPYLRGQSAAIIQQVREKRDADIAALESQFGYASAAEIDQAMRDLEGPTTKASPSKPQESTIGTKPNFLVGDDKSI